MMRVDHALYRAARDYLDRVSEYRTRFRSVPSEEQAAMDAAEDALRRELEYHESMYEGRVPAELKLARDLT